MVLDDMRTEIYELKEKLKTAVQDEREACAMECEGLIFNDWKDLDRQKLCAEAIRARE